MKIDKSSLTEEEKRVLSQSGTLPNVGSFEDMDIDNIPYEIREEYYIFSHEPIDRTFIKLVYTVNDLKNRVKELEGIIENTK